MRKIIAEDMPRQYDETGCLVCVTSAVCFGLEQKADPQKLSVTLGRKRDECLSLDVALQYLIMRGLKVRRISPFDIEKFISEGESYFLAVADPETRKYWTRKRVEIQRQRAVAFQEFASNNRRRFSYDMRLPKWADIANTLDGSRLVLADLWMVGGINHSVMLYKRTGEKLDMYYPGDAKAPLIETISRQGFCSSWNRNGRLTIVSA